MNLANSSRDTSGISPRFATPMLLGAIACGVLTVASPALGQSAYFSLQGNFPAAGDQLDVSFDLFSVNNAEILRFETHSYLGGTNAAGDVITANGFDSNLELFDGGGASRGQNDYIDVVANDYDSLLTWAPTQTSGTPLNPSPLPPDNYRLNLRPYSASVTNTWSLDLVGPANDLTLTDVAPTGTATIDSLKFGTATNVAFNIATYNHSSGVLDVVGDLAVANSGRAAFNLTGGTVNSGYGIIGLNAGSVGTATVRGAGTTWNNGAVSLAVGSRGNGELLVLQGGTVTSAAGNIGLFAGSTGIATVKDAGSSWTVVNNLVVGQIGDGDGTLNIQSGGAVSNFNAFLGYGVGATGTATVTGVGSTWTNNLLQVGRLGTGTLNVEAGSAVTNTTGSIGEFAGSTGMATVTGTGSTWTNTKGLYVAGSNSAAGGTGSLNVTGSGRVDVTGLTKIWSGGTVTLSGGSISANGGLDNTLGGTLNHFGGTLNVTNGVFAPNAGGFVDYSINSANGGDRPVLVIGSGASAAIGRTLYVGDTTQGELRVEAGGAVTSELAQIGASSSGYATVTGTGSMWTINSRLDIASTTPSFGSLKVVAGGSVNSGGEFNADASIGSAVGSRGTARVTGVGSTWTMSGGLEIGSFGTGTLVVEAGGTVRNTYGRLAYNPNSGFNSNGKGTAIVDGEGSTWTISDGLDVGSSLLLESGFGELNVLNGGRVDVTGPTKIWSGGTINLIRGTINANGDLRNSYGGTLNHYNGRLSVFNGVFTPNTGGVSDDYTISGASLGDVPVLVISEGGSTAIGRDLYIGETQRPGQLRVEAGGVVSNKYGFIDNGSATVTGADSTWTNSNDLSIGNLGSGSLYIQDGGSVSNADFSQIGFEPGTTGSVSVTGEGSIWNSAYMELGYFGKGTLNITDGGSVSSSVARINSSSGSPSDATVTGIGSVWTVGSVYVGNTGAGTLLVKDGGAVSNTFRGYIGAKAGSPGTATVTGLGSTWTNEFGLYIGGSESGVGASGTLNVRDAGQVTADSLTIYSSATLNLSIGSLTAPLIDVAGNAILAGTLGVDLDTGFTLTAGDAFTLIDIGGTQTGVFANYGQDDLLGTFDGIDLLLSYLGGDGNDVVAYAAGVATLAGDYNGDGFVSQTDLDLVLLNWGDTVLPAGFDPNAVPGGNPFDNLVSQNELDGVLLNWGDGVPPMAAAIPEPASLAVLAFSGMLLATRRRRSA